MNDKLPIERDERCEAHAGLVLESCSAFLTGEGALHVYGELTTQRPLAEYRTLQLVVFDADGDIIHRGFTNWSAFGVRQSFEFSVETHDLPSRPAKVKVYPTCE
jgi:hypothetical protein